MNSPQGPTITKKAKHITITTGVLILELIPSQGECCLWCMGQRAKGGAAAIKQFQHITKKNFTRLVWKLPLIVQISEKSRTIYYVLDHVLGNVSFSLLLQIRNYKNLILIASYVQIRLPFAQTTCQTLLIIWVQIWSQSRSLYNVR